MSRTGKWTRTRSFIPVLTGPDIGKPLIETNMLPPDHHHVVMIPDKPCCSVLTSPSLVLWSSRPCHSSETRNDFPCLGLAHCAWSIALHWQVQASLYSVVDNEPVYSPDGSKQTICKIMSACISAAVLMKLFHEVMYCYVSKFVTVKLLPNLLIISA